MVETCPGGGGGGGGGGEAVTHTGLLHTYVHIHEYCTQINLIFIVFISLKVVLILIIV